MSELKPKTEAVYPWTTVSKEQIQSTINSMVKCLEVKKKSKKKIAADSLPSIRQALVDIFQGNEELQAEAHDALESYDPEEFLLPFLDGEPGWIISCSVTESMVSGNWGIKSFVLGTKGYFYIHPLFGVGDDDGESLPIIGVWTPSQDRNAAWSCLMQAYTTYWKDFALPPFLGQWAHGPDVFLTDAIATILKKESDAWSTVLDRLNEDIQEDGENGSLLSDLAKKAATVAKGNEADALATLRLVLDDESASMETLLKLNERDSRLLVAAFVAAIGRGVRLGFSTKVRWCAGSVDN